MAVAFCLKNTEHGARLSPSPEAGAAVISLPCPAQRQPTPVNFLIFPANAPVPSSAPPATRTLCPAPRPPRHGAAAVPAEQRKPGARFCKAPARHPGLTGTPGDVPPSAEPRDAVAPPPTPARRCQATARAASAAGMLPERVPVLRTGTDPRAKPASCHCHPLRPRSPRGHGGFAPGKGVGRRLPARRGWQRRQPSARADEMWQACNKPLVTVTFARQPLAG